MKSIDNRIERLIYAIQHHRENQFNTVNGAELCIVEHASTLRDMDKYANGRVFDIVNNTVDWTAKQEILRFLSGLTKPDWDSGLDLAQWCMTSEIGFDVGVLTRILHEARKEKLPIEWVAAAEMDEKQLRFNADGSTITDFGSQSSNDGPQSVGFNRNAIMERLK